MARVTKQQVIDQLRTEVEFLKRANVALQTKFEIMKNDCRNFDDRARFLERALDELMSAHQLALRGIQVQHELARYLNNEDFVRGKISTMNPSFPQGFQRRQDTDGSNGKG